MKSQCTQIDDLLKKWCWDGGSGKVLDEYLCQIKKCYLNLTKTRLLIITYMS